MRSSETSESVDTKVIDKWLSQVQVFAGSEPKLRMPLDVMLDEALALARFCAEYWQPALDDAGEVTRPGLESALGAGDLSADIEGELLELHQAVFAADSLRQLKAPRRNRARVDRARYLIGEIRAAMGYLAKANRRDDLQWQLGQYAQQEGQARTLGALSTSLLVYAELADQYRRDLDGLGGFDVGVIEEARALAKTLHERKHGVRTRQENHDRLEATRQRDRLAVLLQDRMQCVRTAARFVFRHHPDIVRQATSRYQRTRRAAHKKRKAEEARAEVKRLEEEAAKAKARHTA